MPPRRPGSSTTPPRSVQGICGCLPRAARRHPAIAPTRGRTRCRASMTCAAVARYGASRGVEEAPNRLPQMITHPPRNREAALVSRAFTPSGRASRGSVARLHENVRRVAERASASCNTTLNVHLPSSHPAQMGRPDETSRRSASWTIVPRDPSPQDFASASKIYSCSELRPNAGSPSYDLLTRSSTPGGRRITLSDDSCSVLPVLSLAGNAPRRASS